MQAMIAALTIARASWDGPLGPMVLAASARGLCGVWFDGQRHQTDVSAWPHQSEHPVLQLARQQLADYFAGHRRAFALSLDLDQGTPFQRQVWQALLNIPWGSTRSYGEIANALGKPGAVRAVGAAVGRNPLGIVVPCHRVLGARGDLTGYAAGLPRKAALLRLEGAA